MNNNLKMKKSIIKNFIDFNKGSLQAFLENARAEYKDQYIIEHLIPTLAISIAGTLTMSMQKEKPNLDKAKLAYDKSFKNLAKYVNLKTDDMEVTMWKE